MLIEIIDKSIPGIVKNSMKIELSEITSPEKIIAARVTKEVTNYNRKVGDKLKLLVQPESKESLLNRKKTVKIDVEKQIYVALEAFKNNGFFILVDDQQVTELQEQIYLKSDSTISFVKLTQLVGG